MAKKQSATQQLFAQYGAMYYADNPTAKSVSLTVLTEYAAEKDNERSEYESERAYEQMLERKSEPWASDRELMAMDPGDDYAY